MESDNSYNTEKFPKYFFGDTLEEAECLYKDYYSLLNNISYAYSSYSNVSKSDLFGEALIGLARANRDYDSKRSDKFKTFVIYKIKTVLNEYVRKNSGIVIVPAYIKHASRHLELLKSIFKACNNDSLEKCLENEKLYGTALGGLKAKADEAFDKLKRAAKRANITTKELSKRIEFMPTEIPYDDYISSEDVLRNETERLDLVLFIESLKRYLTKTEIEIVDYIMDDIPYNKIAKKFDKSTPWIRHQLINMKKKLKEKMGGIEFNS